MKKQQGPKISIITACYNSQNTIEKTIRSVLNQTYGNIEYIIIDGASKDCTMDIVQKYLDKIDVFVSEKDYGVYDAFNKGIKLASGDFIYFLNSDDCFTTETILNEAISILDEEWSTVDAFYGQVIYTNQDGSIQYPVGNELFLEDVKHGKMIPHQGFFSRKSLYDKHGNFNTNYSIAADFDFLVRILLDPTTNMKFLPLKFAYFRNDGISSNQYELLKEYQKIIKRYFNVNYLEQNTNRHFNSVFYKKLCRLLLNDSELKEKIHPLNSRSVYIFGSMELALLVDDLLIKYGVFSKGFLDNSPSRQNKLLNHKKIYKPDEKIIEPSKDLFVIIATEGFHEDAIKDQLMKLKVINKNILSWRELLY